MKNLSKHIALTALFALSCVSFASTASNSFVSNDAQNLAQCRSLMNAQIGEVDQTKIANIKSKARSFTVNFKVVDGGERSVVQCKLARDQVTNVSCLKGSACSNVTTASTSE